MNFSRLVRPPDPSVPSAASGLAAEQAGGEEAFINADHAAAGAVAQQGGVRNLGEVLGDGP